MARTLLVCLMYLTVLAGLAVAADRVIAQRVFADPGELVPAYRSFQEPSVGVKLHDFEQTDGKLDMLILGNSRTLFDVQPQRVDTILSRNGIEQRSFNLAMPTVDVRFWPPFLTDYYDRPAPKQLLLGVIPRDLDVRNVAAQTEQEAFFASPGFENHDRSGLWRGAEEALSQLFTLRGRLNEVRRVGLRGVLRGQRLDPAQVDISGRGWGQFAPGVAPDKQVLTDERRADHDDKGEILVGKDQIAALRGLDTWIRARGGCLTLFSTPLLYDRDGWGSEAVRRDFVRTMRDFVRTNRHVRFLDVGANTAKGYTLTDFSDGDHLAPSGARKFSRKLADALAEQPRGC